VTAGKYNFIIEQGAQVRKVLTFETDWTGYSARMKIKTLSGALVLSLTSVPVTGDRLVISGNTITIIITTATTTAMNFSQGRYDLELVDPSGEVERQLKGIVAFSREETN
jgi:hypothetical protein